MIYIKPKTNKSLCVLLVYSKTVQNRMNNIYICQVMVEKYNDCTKLKQVKKKFNGVSIIL